MQGCLLRKLGSWKILRREVPAAHLGAYLVQNGVVEVGPTTDILIEQGYEIDRPSRILVQDRIGRRRDPRGEGRRALCDGRGRNVEVLAG